MAPTWCEVHSESQCEQKILSKKGNFLNISGFTAFLERKNQNFPGLEKRSDGFWYRNFLLIGNSIQEALVIRSRSIFLCGRVHQQIENQKELKRV